MNATLVQDHRSLPEECVPYIVRSGDGICHLAAGQVVRTLAGDRETNGGFGAFVGELPLDPRPIPMHYHNFEHDTWVCTRGKLQVWGNGESRVLAPGDFAYVKPKDVHAYQSLAPHSSFFGIVAPGGWEGFFADVGEVWNSAAFPPADRPFDFSRMGPGMAKFDVHPVNAPYVEPVPMRERDRELPAGVASYFLEAGYGDRRVLFDHLSTALLTPRQNEGGIDMRVIEGGRGSVLPTHRLGSGHQFLYVLDGAVAVTLDGEEHRLSAGDAANIPAGCDYGSSVVSGSARWVVATSACSSPTIWDAGGRPTNEHIFPYEASSEGDLDRVRELEGLDVTFA